MNQPSPSARPNMRDGCLTISLLLCSVSAIASQELDRLSLAPLAGRSIEGT